MHVLTSLLPLYAVTFSERMCSFRVLCELWDTLYTCTHSERTSARYYVIAYSLYFALATLTSSKIFLCTFFRRCIIILIITDHKRVRAPSSRANRPACVSRRSHRFFCYLLGPFQLWHRINSSILKVYVIG